MKKTLQALTLAALLGVVSAPALAQAAAPAATAEMSEAEVRKIDKAQGKITLKHGEIKSLDMPPMTMVFRVNPPALLDKLQAGDKIRFKVIDDGGKLTVTEVLPLR